MRCLPPRAHDRAARGQGKCSLMPDPPTRRQPPRTGHVRGMTCITLATAAHKELHQEPAVDVPDDDARRGRAR